MVPTLGFVITCFKLTSGFAATVIGDLRPRGSTLQTLIVLVIFNVSLPLRSVLLLEERMELNFWFLNHSGVTEGFINTTRIKSFPPKITAHTLILLKLRLKQGATLPSFTVGNSWYFFLRLKSEHKRQPSSTTETANSTDTEKRRSSNKAELYSDSPVRRELKELGLPVYPQGTHIT